MDLTPCSRTIVEGRDVISGSCQVLCRSALRVEMSGSIRPLSEPWTGATDNIVPRYMRSRYLMAPASARRADHGAERRRQFRQVVGTASYQAETPVTQCDEGRRRGSLRNLASLIFRAPLSINYRAPAHTGWTEMDSVDGFR
jgi:hypothetical protein